MELYLLIPLILSLLLNAFIIHLHYKTDHLHYEEKSELFDRLSAKNLEEYKYFRDNHPLEVDHNKKILETQRRAEEERIEAQKKVSTEDKQRMKLARDF